MLPQANSFIYPDTSVLVIQYPLGNVRTFSVAGMQQKSVRNKVRRIMLTAHPETKAYITIQSKANTRKAKRDWLVKSGTH